MKTHCLGLLLCALTAVACAPARAPLDTGAVPTALRAEPHEVTLNGMRHYYRVGGNAPAETPPVVFLHGGPGQGSEHFDALTGPYMERELRVVYFDQRGSGHSAHAADGDHALATLVEDIESLRQTLGVPKIALIGHPSGGLLGLESAAKCPEHVSHLVFVAGL